MKKTLTALFFITTIQITSGQENGRGYGIRGEVTAINGYEVKLGTNLGFLLPTLDLMPIGYHGPFVVAGYGNDHHLKYFTSHVGYEWYYLVVAARAGIVVNTDFLKSTVGLMPEAGLTMAGLFSFMYGYNFVLSNVNEIGLTTHRLSLSFTFPVWIDNDWWPTRGVANSY